ncbi:hypothetical protein Xoosp13_279 [Xanthomonas phage Xoo-sp13]|nr:hypothetical protein Xoosp13_279 [Xanthomonas phage Xoo-sp13]
MSQTDRNLELLRKAVEELTNQLKSRNSFSGNNGSGSSRPSRGGSNKSIQQTNENLLAIAKNLEELQQSFKSGGRSIADHFKETIKSINPLNKAFSNLEDVVQNAAETQSQIYAKAAKQGMDYIKAVGGNVKKLTELNSDYAELTEAVNDLVQNQEHYAANQVVFNAKLKKIQDARAKVEQSGVHGADAFINGPLDKFLKRLLSNSGTKLTDNARLGVEQLNEQYAAISALNKNFLADLTNSLNKAKKDFQSSLSNFTKSIGSGAINDVKSVPNFIQSRLQTGFTENQYMQSFGMGVSSDELNQFRATNRDVLNVISEFGKRVNSVSDGTLKTWADQAKMVGITGKEALDFTQGMMRSAYRTGRKFDSDLNSTLQKDAQRIQQSFGGTIQEAAAMIQDYSTQTSNLLDFSKAGTLEQQAAIQKELATRMQLVKWMGYDIQFMQQQEQMRHNARYADIGDRIRKGIFSQLASNEFVRQGGTQSSLETDILRRGDAGFDLNASEKTSYAELRARRNSFNNANRAGSSNTARNGGFSAGISDFMRTQLISDIFQRNAGYDIASGGEADIAAQNIRNSRGNISFEDFTKTMDTNAKLQQDSVSKFDLAVQEFSETIRGGTKAPGAGMLMGAANTVGDVAKTYLISKYASRAVGSVFGAGGGAGAGAGLGARLGSLFGLGAGGGAGAAAAGVGSRLGGVGLAGAAGWGIGSMASSQGQDAYYSDNNLYKNVSKILNPLGYGATAISDWAGNQNSSSWSGIADRVSKTGKYDQSDIDEFVRMRQVGTWNGTIFGNVQEEEADRAAAVQQLNQLVSAATRSRNSSLVDGKRNNGINVAIDGVNNIQRDADGNAIPANQLDPMNRLVAIQEEALGEMKGAKKEDREREERDRAHENVRTRAQQQIDSLQETYMSKF